MQQYKFSYDQTFVAIIKFMIFRILFAFAVYHDLSIDQMNVAIVFLNEIIDQFTSNYSLNSNFQINMQIKKIVLRIETVFSIIIRKIRRNIIRTFKIC